MKGSSVAAAAASVFATTSALGLVKRESPRVVHHRIERRVPESPELQERVRARHNTRLAGRASTKTVSGTLDNFQNGALYFLNATVGTPAQNLRFHLDTGSSDLWANSATSSFCQQAASQPQTNGIISCSVSGTYNANHSTSYQYINSAFQISYADTTGASGDYVSDVVNIGGTPISNQQFGVGYTSNSSEGVMGLGYPALEVAVQVDRVSAYPNIPRQMVSQGLINSAAYSVWLDALSSSTGNILFGGVDTAKFQGSLTTLPILKRGGQYVEMLVALSSVTVTASGTTTTAYPSSGAGNEAALLDSGSTLAYLPAATCQTIFAALGATYNADTGFAAVPCALASNTATYLTFNFSGAAIAVSLAQLILSQGSTGNTCVLGLAARDGAPFTLGDAFLRSAYVVYDIDANEISMAQTNFDGNAPNILEITNGTNGAGGVPSAKGAAQTASVAVTGTGRANLATATTAAASGQPAPPIGGAAPGGGAAFIAAVL